MLLPDMVSVVSAVSVGWVESDVLPLETQQNAYSQRTVIFILNPKIINLTKMQAFYPLAFMNKML
jgi:ribonuclease PH